MLTSRQKLILKAIIEEYVDTNEPVGSKILTERPYLDFSSATIRAEMNFLEGEGYLEKTHTSSGRIPSEEGYKFYVENLVTRDNDIVDYYPMFDEIFDNKYLPREDACKMALDALSRVTGCMTAILGSSANYSVVKKMEAVPLNEKEAVLLIVTSTGALQSQRIEIPQDVNMDDLMKLIDMFDNAMYDHSILEINEILSKEMRKPRIRQIVEFRDDLLSYLLKAFSRFQNGEFYISGLTNIFNQPEFHNHESMEKILSLIDNDEIIEFLKENENGVAVRIGNDHENKNMNDCASIKVSYYVNDNAYGNICVLGPTRMQYKKVIPLVEYVASKTRVLFNK